MYLFSSETGIFQKADLTADDIEQFNFGRHYEIFNARTLPIRQLHRATQAGEAYPTLETLAWDEIPSEGD